MPSSVPVRRRAPRVVKRSNSTAVRRTLEDQKEKAVWRIGPWSRVGVCMGFGCLVIVYRQDRIIVPFVVSPA